MSFRNEFKDFVEGFKFGQNVWQENARTKLLEAQAAEKEPAPYDPAGPDPFKTAPKVPETQTPKKTEVKEDKDGTITGGEGSDTLAGSAGVDTMTTGSTGDNSQQLARRRAIQSIESSGNYRALGPMTGGDRAYGAYQVMGKNVGPWTKAALGRSMSPQEFLADEKAQDAVFDHVFGGYVDKFGEEGAAQAWFGGPGSVGKKGGTDVLGTSVGGYGQRYLAALKKGGGDITQTASSGSDDLIDQPAPLAPEDEGAIPDEEYDTARGEDESGFTSGSPRAGVDVASVVLPDIEFQPVPLPMLPGLRAATGGAIPEPKRYAEGGFEQGIENISGASNPNYDMFKQAQAANPERAANMQNFQQQRMDWARSQPQSGQPSLGGAFKLAGPGLWGLRTPPMGSTSHQALDAAGYWNNYAGNVALPGGQVVPNQPAPTAAAPAPTPPPDVGTHPIGKPAQLPAAPAQTPIPETPAATTPTTTPSQAEFDKLKTKKPVVEDPVKKKEKTGIDPKVQQKAWDIYMRGASMGGGSYGYNAATSRSFADMQRQMLALAKDGSPETKRMVADLNQRMVDQFNRKRSGGRQGGSRAAGGMVYEGFASGGAVPEPEEMSYARGGAAPSFAEEERRAESGIRIGPAATSGLSGHDIAARQRNIRERGVVSYAYDPRELFQPRKKKKGGSTGGDKTTEPAKPKPKGMTTEEKNAERRDLELEPRPKAPSTAGGMTTEEKNAERRDLQEETHRPLQPPPPTDPRLDIPVPQLKKLERETAIPVTADEVVPQVPTSEVVKPSVRTETVLPEPADMVAPAIPAVEAARPVRTTRDVAKPILAGPAGAQRVPATEVAPAVGPSATVQPDDSDASKFRAAQMRIAQGESPDDVLGELELTTPRDLWPLELQNLSLGFAEGGAIPDEEETGRSSTYTTSGPGPQRRTSTGMRTSATRDPSTGAENRMSAQEEQPEEDLAPTPETRSMVAKALDGGMRFLQDTFFRPQGAIATPDDGAGREQGAQRLASGEGAATQEEINQIDDQVDPNRTLDEGDRQMTRLAKIVDWYQQRGRTKDAQAAAGSLLQYGATRFSQLGSVAAQAYAEYQKTGDINDLNEAVKYLEHAYQFIPDGAVFDITIDPKTHRLQAVKTDADGNEVPYDIDASELPGLIRQVQSKSPYWQQITRMADPEGYRSQLAEERQERRDERVDKRQAAREERQDTRQAEREKKTDERQAKRDEEYYKRLDAQEERQQRQSDRVYARDHPDIWPKVNPLLAPYRQAKKALEDDPENEELQAAVDKAASAIWDQLPPNDRRNAELMQDLGIYPEDWQYSGDTGAGGDQAAPAATDNAPPAPTNPAERQVGTIYSNPNGRKARWTGSGWEPVD